MGITYTSKAKDDLVNLDWRVRQKIVSTLGRLQEYNDKSLLSRMHNSDYYKLNINNHLIIGRLENRNFNIITVLEQKKIKFPE